MCSRRWRNRRWEGRQQKRQIRKSKKREGLNYARRATRGMRIVGAGFIEGDILRNPHATSNRIIATIALMFSVVPKKKHSTD
jgi:hypothetical protein